MTTSTRALIIALTEAAGWSAYRLAKEAGLHPKTVKDFIVGRHDTLTANADKMLAALRKATDYAQ